MTYTDRCRGALIGLATGDALGTTLEFRPPGTFKPLTDIVGGGPFDLLAGRWTDDTSMALCMALSLIGERGFDAQDQLNRYVAWMEHGYMSSIDKCFDIGTTTSGALANFKKQGLLEAKPASRSNGSIMRLAPVVIAYVNNGPRSVIDQAMASSRTTHTHDECVSACGYMGLMIGALLRGMPKEHVLGTDFYRTDELAPRVAEVARGSFRSADGIVGSGLAVECLEAALWAFCNSSSFEEGALLAVNLGDDADTTGAVYGQIAGAYYGESGIPKHWLEKLYMRQDMEAIADALSALRPVKAR